GARSARRPLLPSCWKAELVAMATDLAEVVGGAIALYLLFDLPLLLGGVITGAVSLLLLAIQNQRGQGVFESAACGPSPRALFSPASPSRRRRPPTWPVVWCRASRGPRASCSPPQCWAPP